MPERFLRHPGPLRMPLLPYTRMATRPIFPRVEAPEYPHRFAQAIPAAKRLYTGDPGGLEVQIDEDPDVTYSESGGYWVAAWVWVPEEEVTDSNFDL